MQKEGLTPYINEDVVTWYDYCDPAGTQEKSSVGSSITILNSFEIYPIYTSEKIQKDEDEPESIQIIRATLKQRTNNETNLLIDKTNILASDMFRNITYEKKQDGSSSNKYKKDGFYEHPHDVYKYLVKHVMKYLLYEEFINRKREIAYR